MFLQSDNADAVAGAEAVEAAALVEEPVARKLAGVIGAPERNPVEIAIGDPFEIAGDVGLDGDAIDMGHVAEARHGLAVRLADQRLAPGREQYLEAVGWSRTEPIDEPGQRRVVARQRLARVAALGERTVGAAVVAACQRTAIENGQA